MFRKKLNRVFSAKLEPFVLSKQRQVGLLNEYPVPNDLIERSFFQFHIQNRTFNSLKRRINNIVGFFACFYFIFLGVWGSRIKQKGKKSHSKDAIFPYSDYHYPGIIPEEVLDEFEITEINFMSGYCIRKKDISFIITLFKRCPLQFYFISKCLSKLFFYRYIIEKFNPDAIISTSEYSFSSSISTLFCRKNNVEHINVMHGEKFFLVRDSFFEYDRFYIWDEYYKALFVQLRASEFQFRVGVFPHLKMNLISGKEVYDYTYYLAAEPPEVLQKIRDSLSKLGCTSKICIRYHPRYSDYEIVTRIFSGFVIEDPISISLKLSFERTLFVVSLYSSCLLQAYFNQKKIVIDDVSQLNSRLRTLKESGYIIFSKPHFLMSELIENIS